MLLKASVPGAYVAFEEPQVSPVLPGLLGDLERRFRRRFIETHELLGRGDVLRAFDSGDGGRLSRYAKARMNWIDRRLIKTDKSIFIDISKHFLHGLHEPTLEMIKGADIRFIRLIRDPIENMRSYLNRQKSYALDYGAVDGAHNCLRLDPSMMTPGEFYLHAWCETYLRGAALIAKYGLPAPIDLETNQLSDPAIVSVALDRLALPHGAVPAMGPQNTNLGIGRPETTVRAEDFATFQTFRDRLSDETLKRLPDAFIRRAEAIGADTKMARRHA